MNAVAHMLARLPGSAVRRLARRGRAGDAFDVEEARAACSSRWSEDLCGFLNALSRDELGALAGELRMPSPPQRSPDLRAALWEAGAALERRGHDVSPAVQPRPILLGGHLVIQAAPRGMFPPSAAYPREVPSPIAPAAPREEPDSLDELLAAADRALGVRLGRRGRDKGAWGLRAEALLGVATGTDTEPDWRGDVELKTVPIAREGDHGPWRVVEDPAIGMVGEPVLAKLQRTLWLARCDLPGGDATLVSWYLLDWDVEVARLARKYLHDRPTGPAGTTARGLYLAKRFFADAGLLATLNGPPR
jgi:hypothetical protein